MQGNALAKQGKLEEAVAVYNKSLMENRNADTLKRLQVGAAPRWPRCLMCYSTHHSLLAASAHCCQVPLMYITQPQARAPRQCCRRSLSTCPLLA